MSSPPGNDGLPSSPNQGLFVDSSPPLNHLPSSPAVLDTDDMSTPGAPGSSPPGVSSPRRPDSSPAAPGSAAGMPNSSPLHYSSSPAALSASSPMALSSQINMDLNSHRRHNMSSRRGDIWSDTRYSDADRNILTMSAAGGSELGSAPVRVIWGTNVSIQESMDTFRYFLNNFKSKYASIFDGDTVDIGEGEDLVYVDMLNDMRHLGTTNLNFNARNLLAYPKTQKLYYQLINYPHEVIPIMDQTVKDCMVAIASGDASGNPQELDDIEMKTYKVRPFGLDARKGLRELNPSDIDKLVTIKGLVLRATPVIPDMQEAFFRCAVCNHTVVVEIDRGTITEPTRCPRAVCGQINSMQLVHNRCRFNDKQVIRLQETPDVIPDGQTPHSVSICVYDELVDYCKAGDRVQVTGVYRSVPVRVNPLQRAMKNLFKTYVDVVHVQKIDTRRLGADVSTSLEHQIGTEQVRQQADLQELRILTEEDIAKIQETSKRTDVYDLLSRSLAPSIFEQDDVKKGILLQLFGGTNKTFEKGGSPRYRGDINVLLCGDPSTSKSQMLQYVHKIAPRGIYTSGKGSSAVGLTAYVTRDTDTKQIVLESGALVLSDGGVCCIDEFDKMSDSTRSVLHEVMEQQTVSIAKAGIITTLNARTSILASANPINSKYDVNLPVPQNIDLPPTLLSRFDLVYLMIDKVDVQADRRLAQHLTDMYLEDRPENASREEILPVEFLTMYISYAKQNVQPQITPEAKELLVKSYVQMRKLGSDASTADKRITATTRQLESMIRLSEAHAKMRLSETVSADDVAEAVRLIKSAIKQSATDPNTGTIDMDLVQTGRSSAQREMQQAFKTEIMRLLENAEGIHYDELIRKVVDLSTDRVDTNEIVGALRALAQEGQIIIQTGPRRIVRKAFI
ncbi:DNA replication licensing factor MCM4 [Wickerhamiella sorbophila]|uniref:DNA replication licensing factor MCM4 n=1 Tax=Wickerhamiella sorbophila TaxID=45607 RepID=A0A2T0FDA3_9ASCO|nr:DNA replication licensing factor MCM4 [Wickerhamiella sorbophila]PRT52982.1 DNA replication licensing factor MCM4 [Wickerhamiella sorbophila]